MHGIEHGDDIRDRRSRLDVVNRVEDKSPARRKDFATAQNLFADFSWRSEGQNLLRIHSTTPEDNLISEVRL